MTDRERELETENARLHGMLARNGVILAPSVELPSDSELEKLLGMIEHACPTLRPPAAEAAAHRVMVKRAIYASAFMRRQAEPNQNFYATSFLDSARGWLRQQGVDSSLTLRSFLCSCVANGVSVSPLDPIKYATVGLVHGALSRPIAMWSFVLKSSVPKPVEIATRRPTEILNLNMIRPSA
jgi:hypothetical protein